MEADSVLLRRPSKTGPPGLLCLSEDIRKKEAVIFVKDIMMESGA